MSAVEETLGWEAEQRPRAAAAAILGGLLILIANILLAVVYRDYPSIDVLEALREAASGQQTLKAEQVLFIDDHLPALLSSGLLSALGLVGMGLALAFLYRATAARRPETPAPLRYAVLAGPVTAAVGSAMFSIARAISASDFAGKPRAEQTSDAAQDALAPAAAQAGQVLLLVGTFAFALAIVFVSLNAMRAGLLTRFLGVLGVIVGVIWVLPLDPLGLVRSLWLIFIGLLIANRVPGGAPPAWSTGRAEPWPTQQQIREQREAARAGEAPAAEPAAAATPASGQPARRKRKRRR